MSLGMLFPYAACSVEFIAGPSAQFAVNSGPFASVTRNGAGDVTLQLNPSDGIDETECVCLLSARGLSLVGSDAVSMALVHTSDTQKEVTIVQEAAMGAASVPADIDFDLVILKVATG